MEKKLKNEMGDSGGDSKQVMMIDIEKEIARLEADKKEEKEEEDDEDEDEADDDDDDDEEEEEEEEEQQEQEQEEESIDYLDRPDEKIDDNGIVFFDLDKKEKKFFRFGKETRLVDKCLKIQHSLNGLVLLSLHGEEIPSLHVYNPVTGESINLPVPEDIVYNDCPYNNNGFVVNLAYDSVMEKYKVVLCCCDGGNRIKEYSCRVITLGVEGGDSWRAVVFPKECHLPDVASWKTVFAYGSLHWLANVPGKPHLDESEVDEDAWDQREIVSFDVSGERFHTIQFPKGASEKCTTIHEMEGSLCYIDHISDNELCLWVLKKDTQQQQYEWTEKCSFHVPGILGRFWWDRGIAIVTYPRLKMIYAPAWMGDEDHADMYWNFHCYDVQSKQLETMFEASEMRVFLHVNSLAYF
ncbi:uncharacterized protein LOC113317842 isoform X2 [Papaver somniferum]|uniref:uncharacterized protein LOC113317842 isoform X2 n=1 Tax=Papaver somniferum TaxID=3469 RepID=UPI000E6F7EF0|nr:uncharacterized protein LOC113317842 isoform X2 [Papaver somniferum]